MNAKEINTIAKELVERNKEGRSFKNKKEGAGWSQGAWVGVGYDRENLSLIHISEPTRPY